MLTNLSPVLTLTGLFLGAILGSFSKAIADRSLQNKTFFGRSFCPSCKKTLRWFDLIPIFSYLSLQGKCRYCKKPIQIEYLWVEVIMTILVGFLFWLEFHTFKLPATSFQLLIIILDLFNKVFFITILAILFLTDIKEMFIPDRVIFPALVIGFLSNLILTITRVSFLYFSLSQTLIGKYLLPPHTDYFQRHALDIAGIFFWQILMGVLIGGFFWFLIIITKGKGMGGGDVKLGAFIGLILGFPQSLVAIMLSFLSGAIISIILVIFGKKHFKQAIPFGPFLVLGSLIALFWGEKIINWYLNIVV